MRMDVYMLGALLALAVHTHTEAIKDLLRKNFVVPILWLLFFSLTSAAFLATNRWKH